MRLRLALLGVAALVPLLLAEVQEHEALRFCSDKEASKRDLFKSYWRKCSTEAWRCARASTTPPPPAPASVEHLRQ